MWRIYRCGVFPNVRRPGHACAGTAHGNRPRTSGHCTLRRLHECCWPPSWTYAHCCLPDAEGQKSKVFPKLHAQLYSLALLLCCVIRILPSSSGLQAAELLLVILSAFVYVCVVCIQCRCCVSSCPRCHAVCSHPKVRWALLCVLLLGLAFLGYAAWVAVQLLAMRDITLQVDRLQLPDMCSG